MSVIILDGPEKAGKTTLAARLRDINPGIRYRHWGPVPEHWSYQKPLLHDIAAPYPVIWDRSWASEAVYGELLARDRELRHDPFLGEWLWGRVAISAGIRIMVAPTAMLLQSRRNMLQDDEDLPIPPATERGAFVNYADRWNWSVFATEPTEQTVRNILEKTRIAQLAVTRGQVPPKWAGPSSPAVVFVGESRNKNYPVQIPFASEHPTQYGRILGPLAMLCGWTNADDCNPLWIMQTKVIIACGTTAYKWCASIGRSDATQVPHPSWLYRWGKAKALIKDTEETIKQLVQEATAERGSRINPVF